MNNDLWHYTHDTLPSAPEHIRPGATLYRVQITNAAALEPLLVPAWCRDNDGLDWRIAPGQFIAAWHALRGCATPADLTDAQRGPLDVNEIAVEHRRGWANGPAYETWFTPAVPVYVFILEPKQGAN